MAIDSIDEYLEKRRKLIDVENWEGPLSDEKYYLLKDCINYLASQLPAPDVADEHAKIIEHLLSRGLDRRWIITYA